MWLLPNRYRSSSEILTTSHSDSDAAPLAELTPQLEDGYGIKVLHDPQQPVVDIVFVHGLTGGQVSTWAAEGAAQPWPQSFLAKDIPTARISAFGYDADVVKVFGQAGQNKLRQHASNLVACVADLQFESKSAPPIIFVAHSLGGLVCENMLTIASSGEQHWREVLESTIAIAFLGTPHRGSDSASWAKIAGNLVNVARRTNTSILGVLEPDSEVLENVTNDFHNLRRSREDDGKKKVQITCYGEEKAMEMGGKSVLVVPTQSASLDGCTFVTLSGCDHSSMTKFGTKNSEYGKVRTQIKRWIQAMTPAPGSS
ncbi:hypothetical protein K432DRAFT_365414 [Lepidopterella palustris CBS 459.81]|uniref:GPI inositol-deacylase n=1 Tax=Lepidopterella palustris CBS 459.81 TaxID=1314670 RepID=A0A8E2J856_9PEZI|nr:hypothetical protein K432DRAFT_365414 [Lepidopterella palustris CBS 459.81]